MFAESNTRVWDVIRDWLDQYFPAKARPGTALIWRIVDARPEAYVMARAVRDFRMAR